MRIYNQEEISSMSIEEIKLELIEIILSDKPSEKIEILRENKTLEMILPELQRCYGFNQHNPNHDKDIYYHTLSVLDNTSPRLILRLAALLHDIGKPDSFTIDENKIGHFYRHNLKGEDISKEILTRLKFHDETISKVCILVREHMSKLEKPKERTIRRLINRVGHENLQDLFELQIADIKGSSNKTGIEEIYEVWECFNRLKILEEFEM